MAKGFKVIPKETPKKETWDYDKIKERVKGKQIVFCILAYNYVKADFHRKDSTHVGYRTNMEASRIPNNGGL